MRKSSLLGSLSKGLFIAAVALGVHVSTAQAGQQDDQIAIHLGAIQLGLTIDDESSQADLAAALYQGRAVLKSTVKKAQPSVEDNPISTSEIQSELLRSQILQATQMALSMPINASIDSTVVNTLTKTVKVKATMNPKKTTASAIFAYTAKRLPNFGPGLVGDSITGALTQVENAFVFNYKDETAALKDVNKLAGSAMKTALKAYAKGTVNWAGVPVTGTVPDVVYLPNFSTKTIPAKGSNLQAPDLAGLANAAGAIAGAAADALNSATLTTDTTTAFRNLGQSLIKGAASFQKTSTAPNLNALNGGSVAGAGFGAIAMVSDGTEPDWNGNSQVAILNAIVAGGIKGSKANAYAFAVGVAGGFTAAYLNAEGMKLTVDQFQALVTADILQQFTNNGVKNDQKFNGVVTDLTELINTSIADVYTAQSSNYDDIAGGNGLQLPGTPTPVTDTVGL